jgi:hypothetical protein
MHIPVVQPVQVDVVGLQAAQRLLAGGDDRLAARTATVGIPGIQVAAELGGKHQPVALGLVAPDVITENLLRVALGVEIGGINEVAALLQEPVDDLLGLLDGSPPAQVLAESHRAQTQRAHAQSRAAQRDVVIQLHASILL